MKIKKIHVENYKTYKFLDLDLEVTDDRPIILIGGGNGCGKTTLFDAIYHALYGLKIKDARQFEELFNAGVKMYGGVLIQEQENWYFPDGPVDNIDSTAGWTRLELSKL